MKASKRFLLDVYKVADKVLLTCLTKDQSRSYFERNAQKSSSRSGNVQFMECKLYSPLEALTIDSDVKNMFEFVKTWT